MIYIFDASSILALTREFGEKVIDFLKGNVTVSLALYEMGNVLWKECSLLKRLSVEEAVKTLDFVFSLDGVMRVLDVKSSRLGRCVLANAVKLNITYYDSVYLTVADEVKGVLVTDDTELARASRENGVKTLGSKEFVRKFK